MLPGTCHRWNPFVILDLEDKGSLGKPRFDRLETKDDENEIDQFERRKAPDISSPPDEGGKRQAH